MSRRNQGGQFVSRQSPLMLTAIWIGSFLSLGMLAFMGLAVRSDFAGFRSCNNNNSGLIISACGKESVNPGDILLLILFGLSVALTVTLFTAAWRTIRRKA